MEKEKSSAEQSCMDEKEMLIIDDNSICYKNIYCFSKSNYEIEISVKMNTKDKDRLKMGADFVLPGFIQHLRHMTL